MNVSDYNKQTDLEVDYPGSSSESDAPPSGNYKNNRGSQQQQHQKLQPQQQQQQPQQSQQPQRPQTAVVTKNVSNQITSVYDKPRAPPKIRRPVPINERDRYDYTSASKTGQQAPASAVAISTTTAATTTTTTTTTAVPPTKPKGKEQQPSTEDPSVEYYDDEEEEVTDEEYVAEPEVAPAAKPVAAVLKPEPAKPIKAAARTSVVADYDTDRSRQPLVATVVRPKASRASASAPQPQPQPQLAMVAAARKKPTSDHVDVADEYEDEVPVATTRHSIAAATKQRASGPFLARPSKPLKVRAPATQPVSAVPEEEEQQPAVYVQQHQAPVRQPQRVSVRQVMAAPHRNRPQPSADQPYAQYNNNNNNNKQIRAAGTINHSRRPVRPIYEYADDYYDEQ